MPVQKPFIADPEDRIRKRKDRIRRKDHLLGSAASWVDKTVRERHGPNIYVITLNADFEIDTQDYQNLEKRILALDGVGRIIAKHANRFEDTVIIEILDLDTVLTIANFDGVDLVVPRPRSQAKISDQATHISSGRSCSLEDAYLQEAALDHLTDNVTKEALANLGGGVIVVVWDFLPKDTSLVSQEDLYNRPGGPVVIIDEDSHTRHNHGTAVASTCCGNKGGFAPGANVVILGSTDSVSTDLDTIEAICRNSNKPVIVNMSFTLEFHDVTDPSMQTMVKHTMEALTEDMKDLKQRYPRLIFVLCASNENLNVCDTTDPVNADDCQNCYYWPQSRLGTAYSYKDLPFVTVGSTLAPTREKAFYSDHGACVHVFANGSVVCALDTDVATGSNYMGFEGTSFSAPMFSGILALRYSQRLDASGDEIVQDVIENFTVPVTLSDGLTYPYAQVPAALREKGADPSAYNGGIGFTADGPVASVSDQSFLGISTSNWQKIVISIPVILLICFAVGWFYRRMERKRQASRAAVVASGEKGLASKKGRGASRSSHGRAHTSKSTKKN